MRYRCDSPLLHFNQREQTMKLTKEQITEKREELCKVLVAMNKQKAKADPRPPRRSRSTD